MPKWKLAELIIRAAAAVATAMLAAEKLVEMLNGHLPL